MSRSMKVMMCPREAGVEIGQRVHDAQHVDATHPEHKAHRKSGRLLAARSVTSRTMRGSTRSHTVVSAAHTRSRNSMPRYFFKIGQEPADER